MAINGANTTDGTLYLSSAKGAYVCRFHSGATANLELCSGLATGTVFIQEHLGPVVIGASSAQTGFKNTIGGTTCFLTDVRVLASVIIDMDCQVKRTLITSSDSRIKDQVEDLDDNVCVNILISKTT